MNRDILELNQKLGTDFPANAKMAMDADYIGGAAQTATNGGILAALTTVVTPNFIEALVAPMKMAQIFDERQFGDRVTSSVNIPVIELNGETSAYGDFNDNGVSDSNVNWVARQPFEYQTHIKIGIKEVEVAGAAKYDLVGAKTRSSILQLNKFQNQTYLYGVSGLQNYGVLNSPDLLPDVVGTNWATLDSLALYNEVLKIYTKLVAQGNGLVEKNDPMLFIMSPSMAARLLASNQYGLNAMKYIEDNLPNLRIETVPEYSTPAGEKVQLILESYLGQKTVDLAFTSKLLTGSVEVKTTGWLQKRMQSSLGAIVYYPQFVAGYLGSNTAL